MTKFLLVYSGGGDPPATPEEQKEVMDAWMGWFGGLGDAVVDIGNPVGPAGSLGAAGSSGLTGYSLLTADSHEDALGKASGCPILASGGGIEVYEAFEM